MTPTPEQRNLAAEARAVEAGHHAILATTDRGRPCVRVVSDTHPDLRYEVTCHVEGEIVVLACTPSEADATHRALRSTDGIANCMHQALAARRLEREGLLAWRSGRWVPGPKAPRPAADDADPFAIPGYR